MLLFKENGTSKAAINYLTQSIAVQYAEYGIRCNAVLPGLILTEFAKKGISPEFLKIFLPTVPLNRVGTVCQYCVIFSERSIILYDR